MSTNDRWGIPGKGRTGLISIPNATTISSSYHLTQWRILGRFLIDKKSGWEKRFTRALMTPICHRQFFLAQIVSAPDRVVPLIFRIFSFSYYFRHFWAVLISKSAGSRQFCQLNTPPPDCSSRQLWKPARLHRQIPCQKESNCLRSPVVMPICRHHNRSLASRLTTPSRLLGAPLNRAQRHRLFVSQLLQLPTVA